MKTTKAQAKALAYYAAGGKGPGTPSLHMRHHLRRLGWLRWTWASGPLGYELTADGEIVLAESRAIAASKAGSR